MRLFKVAKKANDLFLFTQGEKSVYNSFTSGHKEQSQSAHEALLRAKLLSNEHHEEKEDCTEGTLLKDMCLCGHLNCVLITVYMLHAVLLKLAEGCNESDTLLMLGYLLAIAEVQYITRYTLK